MPIRRVGRLVLDRCVDNFFAETEQVAFCTNNIVPGVDFTNDPLLQGRNFSYLDTQVKRLGGPNFTHIPVNAPKCPFHNFQQDGHMAMVNPIGRVNYEPNSWGGAEGGPREDHEIGFRSFPAEEAGPKVRERLRELRRPLQPGTTVLCEPDRSGARPYRRRTDLRIEQGRDDRQFARGWCRICRISTPNWRTQSRRVWACGKP